MKKLAVLALIVMCSACGLVEVCVICTETSTGIEREQCGSPDEVQEFEDDLESTGAQYGQEWSCTGA